MHVSNLLIENFRIFGSQEEGAHLDLALQPGLNVLIGVNDSGKSAVVDAIRYTLWTTAYEFNRFTEDDFHVRGAARADSLRIQVAFNGISVPEAARYAEWLEMTAEGPCLYVTVQATRLEAEEGTGRGRIAVTYHAGKEKRGPAIEGDIREFLRATYLRPLRDAEAELSAGRNSRLSQILRVHPSFSAQAQSDYSEGAPPGSPPPQTLVGIMRQAEHGIKENRVIKETQQQLNDSYLSGFSIGDDTLSGEIGVAGEADLRQILEKLELWLRPQRGVDVRTRRGLGYNNALFMATELLLLGKEEHSALPLLLIEEPEAHLHPQLQYRLMDFLEDKAGGAEGVQILLTSHSPNLASRADLARVTMMCEGGRAYSLHPDQTKLATSDYAFLRRFLDVTKANLFFAKGVLIVEGDAENLLLPAIAKGIGRPLHAHGVSIVNVGTRGLFRYSRIFQRTDGRDVPVKVACIADRDIPPSAVTYVNQDRTESQYTPEQIAELTDALKSSDGGSVRTFVSPKWTLEYDLAHSGLAEEVHVAIQLAKAAKAKGHLSREERDELTAQAKAQFQGWGVEQLSAEALAARVYEPLCMKRASKAETAQFLAGYLEEHGSDDLRQRLPSYLVDAIDHATGNTPSPG